MNERLGLAADPSRGAVRETGSRPEPAYFANVLKRRLGTASLRGINIELRTADPHIRRLRKALDEHDDDVIRTVRDALNAGGG